MGHEITKHDTFGEVRVNGRKAWHGIGVEIADGQTARDVFPEIGLDWETELLPLYAAAWDRQTQDVRRIKVHGSVLHVRSDLYGKTDNEADGMLGIVSDKYKPISNLQLAEFADLLCGLDASIVVETAGSLRGGKRVFCLCRLPQSTARLGDSDLVNNYVLIVNGHDGVSSFECYLTSVRVVCANTLRMSAGSARRKTTFSHTGDVTAKVESARRALGIVLSEAEQLNATMHALAERNLSAVELVDYAVASAEASFPDSEKKREEMIGRIIKNMRDKRQMLPGIEDTAWAAYNAVSQYQDHERGRGKPKPRKMTPARTHSNLFGMSHREKTRAFEAAKKLVATA